MKRGMGTASKELGLGLGGKDKKSMTAKGNRSPAEDPRMGDIQQMKVR